MGEQKQGASSKQQSQMEGPAAYAPHSEGEKKGMKPADKQKQGGAAEPQDTQIEPQAGREKRGVDGEP